MRIEAKRGQILGSTASVMAVISALYIFTSIFGYQKTLVKDAKAADFRTEIIQNATILTSNSRLEPKSSGAVVSNINDRGANIIVEANINGKTFPAKLDTGLGFADVCLSSNLVGRLGLKVSSVGEVWPGTTGGICQIGKFDIGAVSIISPKAVYLDQFWEKQLFGISYDQEYQFTIGLGILEKFSYIMIDTRSGVVRFSKNQKFEPLGGGWGRMEMRFGQDRFGQRRLFVRAKICGVDTELIFDTCGGSDIKLTNQSWGKIKDSAGDYQSYLSMVTYAQFGQVECETIRGESLTLASQPLASSQLKIISEQMQYAQNILPISVFEGKAVIIDFLNMVLWAKQ